MARSGRAAAAALEARGADVVRADWTLGNDTDLTLLAGPCERRPDACLVGADDEHAQCRKNWK